MPFSSDFGLLLSNLIRHNFIPRKAAPSALQFRVLGSVVLLMRVAKMARRESLKA